ncbi:hypothetical protein [Streptomyces rapamycinicus]|uniref:Uncharacterized protein n=2 Tax=Streptomyces rapamycinicus TaxID=1226757 RepID=A0A0A0N3C4_STRRN|nr:hypothetical protein [Streptomyces rapamycinicus]AGP51967.1 hypothetical protein M271_01655 [Streptomyces rapamycinicus NRRL 5491]MBB4779388.1 3-hydroxybutyryl-CoA dehydrogenase [Streptomyces rapamycinicus]RLV75949.1 hypothetical protein D3C57_142025 [Streptomyces rapamycinicus NRRL 5491]
MGATLLFHLGAGERGLEAFCERYADSFNRWFDDLGRPHLDEATSRRLVDGLRPISESHPIDALSRRRDALLTELITAARGHAAPGAR